MKNLSVVVLFIVLFFHSCTKESTAVKPAVDRTPPTLEVPFVGTASVQFFAGFGFTDSATASVCRGYNVVLSDTQIRIVSPLAGIVDQLIVAGNGECDMIVKKSTASIFSIRLKHITQPAVAAGDEVNAGSILGKVNSSGQAYMEVQEDNQFRCPAELGNAGFNYAFQQALNKSNLLNADSSNPAVCTQSYLP